MIWLPFLFAGLLWADDEPVVEKYCFKSAEQMERAHAQFRAIAVRADRVEKDGPCMVISTPPHRRELIQKYLYSNHPDMAVSFSSEELRKDHCNLKIEKISVTKGQGMNVELGKSTQLEARETHGSGSETINITTTKDFEISVDQDKILGDCRYITPERYEITITVLKEQRPLMPPVPPGTVVVVTSPPPNQETSSLKTQLQLQRGSRIEIGSIVRDLKNKAHEASADPKLEMQDDVRKQEVKTYLSIQ